MGRLLRLVQVIRSAVPSELLGFLAEPCEITTLTSAGPREFIASSRAPFRSFGTLRKKPLPPGLRRRRPGDLHHPVVAGAVD
jgi:hypothetical protein